MKINIKDLKIKLCDSKEVKDIYKTQNIIILKKDISYHLRKKGI